MVASSFVPTARSWAGGHSWRVPVSDAPWRRLPWILPIAVALWVLALWGFGRFIASPPPPPPEKPPLDAQIIEIPPPPPPAPPPPVAKPLPEPVQPKLAKLPPPRLPTPPVKLEPPQPTPPPVAPENPQPAPAPPPPPPPPQKTEPSINSDQGNSGAYAIVKPEPKIPDDLIDDAVKYRASIKFNIATDGTVTVELTKPTPNPTLNRLYLDTFKNWKFYPAMVDGKPVASSQTISPKINPQ